MVKELLMMFLVILRKLFQDCSFSDCLDSEGQDLLQSFMTMDPSGLEDDPIIKPDGYLNVFNDTTMSLGRRMFQQAIYLIMVLCTDGGIDKELLMDTFVNPSFIQILSGILLGRCPYPWEVRECTIISDLFRNIFRLDSKDRIYFFDNLSLFQIFIRNEDYRRFEAGLDDLIDSKGFINVADHIPMLYPGFYAAEVFKTGIVIRKDSVIMPEIERLREKRFIISDGDSHDKVLGDPYGGMFESDCFEGFEDFWEFADETKKLILLIYRYIDLLEKVTEPPIIEL